MEKNTSKNAVHPARVLANPLRTKAWKTEISER